MVRFQKNYFPYWVLITCIFSITVCGCFDSEESGETGERIYATVNGANLTESELRTLVPAEFYERLTLVHKKEIVKEWVNNEVLYQEALRLDIDKEPEIARILEKSKRGLLSTEILERRLADIKIPGEDELKQYYEEHSDYFILQGDEYVVRYALFDNMNDAKDFYAQVKKGDSFSEIAEKKSKDPSAKLGGELGSVNEESVEPAVWNEIINTFERLGLRKISSPFSVIGGFGIVIVDEVYEMGTLKPYESVREQILDLYMIDKREEAKKSLLLKLLAGAEVDYRF